ncbi:glycoside hydrolase family 76 protein [Babjeviella inositovora NRRL Y-12698]|uniref:Glycoside hydrolase family 76 protein n=1 Tax=Babjeviella inositovora NRRL Y-12698 TaxID=984486 RepID=A0A1E3QTX9_9ASCO|nr:glycoside hydrolase family 76 protein [Babjeviella inositovora NRRL Y-12698]ODQ81014.1 glycoside hydrolase family 76 protein [Babjeviella inositovora NRRL Y-12698]
MEGYSVVRNMWLKFWNSSKGTFISPVPCSGVYGQEGKFNVWSMSVGVQAIVDGARLYPQELGPLVKPAVDAMMRYKSPQYKGFCAAENFGGNKDIYYDDDAQVAQALITAYEATGYKPYLDEGRELVRFLMGGWNQDDDVLKGGMLWHIERLYVNACTTAECAKAALALAKCIPSESSYYVEFAARCIRWQIDFLQDKGDKLIKDGCDRGSTSVNDTKWSYNTGTTISAAALLYSFTKDETWKQICDELVGAAIDTNTTLFDRDYGDHEKRYWRDPSYFIQLLFEGLADYVLVFGEDATHSERIKYQIHRHLVLFHKYMYDDKDGLYFMTFEPHRIPEKYELYRKEIGDKGCGVFGEDRQGGDGNPEDRPSCKTLIGSGSAARIWFQGTRVVTSM